MNKKLLAVAITGALGAVPAVQADTANVNISGKFYPAFVNYSGGELSDVEIPTSDIFSIGEGVADQDAVESFNSYIQFRADFDIGGGMKAITQVEQSLEIDTSDDAVWSSRNSAAGLQGGFGTVLLGRWDTPFKELHFPTNMFGTSSGSPISNSNLLSRTPYSQGSSAASFHRRQDNSIQYWSPDMNGLQFKVMYGTEEDDDGLTDPTRTSASVVYEQGPLLVGFAYEVHDDFFGAASGLETGDGVLLGSGNGGTGTGSKDTGWDITVVYKVGKSTEIGFDFESIKWEIDGQTAGNIESYERDAWRVGVEHQVGKWTLGFNYGSAEEGDCSLVGVASCSTDGLDGTQTTLGAKYDLAKNASIYGWWTKIDNGNSASYSFLENAPTGADPSAYAIGVLLRW